MAATLQGTDVDAKIHSICLQGDGQITVPQTVWDDLDVTKGDMLTLFQIGNAILLIPRPLQVPRLADKIADMMQEHGTSLADLLAGLEEEREAMWRESQGNV